MQLFGMHGQLAFSARHQALQGREQDRCSAVFDLQKHSDANSDLSFQFDQREADSRARLPAPIRREGAIGE